MSISIVIPNWNGRELLEKNLPSVVLAAANPKNKIEEIIVVDDKSTDDSVAYLTNNFSKKIKLVRHTKNRGFASTVNTGARTAKGGLICLLNTDVIPEENFLESIHIRFKRKNVFAVSLHEKGYGPAFGKFEKGFVGHGLLPEYKKITNSFWVSGGSGVYRRNIWMKLKGMDEKLLSPYYWEDFDLCYRAQKRGYEILWDPRARVVHKHEGTMVKLNQKKLNRIRERNQLLVIWKNLTSKNLMKKHRKGLADRIKKGPGYLRIVLMALGKLPKVIKARRVEKKESKVSDEAIFAKWM